MKCSKTYLFNAFRKRLLEPALVILPLQEVQKYTSAGLLLIEAGGDKILQECLWQVKILKL